MNIIDTDKIDRNYPVEFVIYEMLNTPYGFKGDVVDSLCRALAAETSGRKFYSKEYVAYLDRRKILISPIKAGDACEVSVEKGAHRAYCGNSVLYMEYLDIDNISTLSQPENIALIDADKLEYPLLLRRWTEGDTFVPIGMSGHKKVSDYLIDAKVSMPEKQRQFVLLSGGRIVWVVGRRMSEEFKIDSSTENILKITKEII
ncbi:MAG: tRNA lysidine(34) synthetase TilS [Alistipes putredinis]|nr:MAG: tRNA lysidine(34) synthetase TilS [Alistipes putredinis]